MLYMVMCVAIFAHSGDLEPISTTCSDAPIAMSDEFLDVECRPYEACEVTRVNPEWVSARVCPNDVTSHPIAWIETLEITLAE